MEADENEDGIYYFSSSAIVKLIERIKKMTKNPELDNNLGESLDTFMSHLNDTQHYLSNGIFNVRFAEAGLFLQSSVELYGKKVDVLFDTTLKYQMQLCSYKNNEQSTKEIAEIAERIKKRKRKKLVVKDINITNGGNFLTHLWGKSDRLLSVIIPHVPTESIHFQKIIESILEIQVPEAEMDKFIAEITARLRNESDGSVIEELKIQLQEFIEEQLAKQVAEKETIQTRIAEFIDLWQTPINCDFIDEDEDEKVCNYIDLFGNSANVEFEVQRCCTPTNYDSVIEFNGTSEEVVLSDHQIEEVRGLCLSKSAVVNVTRLPKNLMDGFKTHNVSLVQALIHKLITDTTTPGCDDTRIESLLQDHDMDNTEDPGYNSAPTSQFFSESQACKIRMSNDDSGIFCQFSYQTGMEVDDTLHGGMAADTTIPEENEAAETCASNVNALSFSNFFAPLSSSTPKRVPLVRLERISRKRMLELSHRKTPKPKKMARFKWLKTITTSKKKFEKFHNQNYVPSVGEGIIIPWSCDDSSSEGDDNNNNIESDLEETERHFNTSDFCKGILTELLDEISFAEPDPLFSSTIENQQTPSTPQQPLSTTMQKRYAMCEWKDFITPFIKEAESRSKFNIHEYGTNLMDAIPENETLLFKELVAGKDSGEVARYFVALLQLVNMYNIDLINTCPGELASEKLEMRLLTRERYHEHLDDYQAPSANTSRDKLALFREIQSDALHRSSTLSNYPDISVPPALLRNYLIQRRNRSKRQRID